MNDLHFWNRVDELLDERLDPFEDRRVQDALREDPSRLVELERLTGCLTILNREPSQQSRSPFVPYLVLAASLVALVAFSLLREIPELPAPEVAQLDAQRKSLPQISSYRLIVSDSGPLGERTAITEDGRSIRSFTQESPDSGPNRTMLTVIRSPRRLP